MKSSILLSILVLVTGSLSAQTLVPPIVTIDDRGVAFENVNVIPMINDDRVIPSQTVLIEGDRISAVGRPDDVPIPDGTLRIDATGKYLIPGLAEMHGHIPPLESTPDRYVEDALFLYLAGGVTTVRGMLGYDGQLELRERVLQGELDGPNLYLAGPSFSDQTIQSPEEARERVQQQVEEGWDLLKIHPGLTLEEYQAMAETANEAGIRFGGHVPADVGLENAILLGQHTIDHLDGYIAFMDAGDQPVTPEKLDEAIELTLENDVWLIPTQAVWETIIGAAEPSRLLSYEELKYMPPQIANSWRNRVQNQSVSPEARVHAENRQILLKALSDAGANILMGTDAPQLFSVPGFSLRRELALMEEAGLTPYEILKSGTFSIGQYLSDNDTFGTIETGSRADLLLLSENPFENIRIVHDHDGVMVRGLWYPRDLIDQKLMEIEEAYD